VVYTNFYFPEPGANVITTDSSDWATNCPEYKVKAVQMLPILQHVLRMRVKWKAQFAIPPLVTDQFPRADGWVVGDLKN
jgi:predicted molibdopterin-dependent oxidoreductase YjgC